MVTVMVGSGQEKGHWRLARIQDLVGGGGAGGGRGGGFGGGGGGKYEGCFLQRLSFSRITK